MRTKNTILLVITISIFVLSILIYILMNVYLGLIVLFSSLLLIIIIVMVSSQVEVEEIAKKKTKKIKKEHIVKKEPELGVQISRGFKVIGDSICFFVKIENKLKNSLNQVAVRIQIPPSIKLDYKTPSKTFSIGSIDPGKEKIAEFFLIKQSKKIAEINSTLETKDSAGTYQITKIETFQINSSLDINSNGIDKKNFDLDFEKTFKQIIKLPLIPKLNLTEIKEMLKNGTATTLIESTNEVIKLAGKTPEGLDLLIKSEIEETKDGPSLSVSVACKNQSDLVGLLFVIKDIFKESVRLIPEQFEDLSLD